MTPRWTRGPAPGSQATGAAVAAAGWAALVAASLAILPAPGVEAQLQPVPLDTIPVLGSRVSVDLPLRTRSIQVIDGEELRSLPARSVADVLRWGLGVEVGTRSPAQSDLSIRGAGFEQVLVLVDGKRMSDPQTGHFDLNLAIPLDRVERIEILRGPASVLYGGDAVGGVVNVVTRDDPSWGFRGEGGSFGTRTFSGGGGVRLGGTGSLQLSGEMGSSDGHREGTDWEQVIGSAMLRLPLLSGRLTGEAGRGERDFGAADFYAPFPSFESTQTTTASLGWRTLRPGAFHLEPRVTWREHDDDFILIRDDPAQYRNQHVSTQLAGELVSRIRLSPALSLALGGEAGRDRLESGSLGDREEERWALFGEGAYTTGGGVDLSAGLRLDDHDRWGDFRSPSAAIAIPVDEDLRLRASWGKAFRGPSWTERHYSDPAHEASPDLRPEESEAWEVGFQWVDDGDFRLDAAMFRRTSRNLIDWARPHGSEALWETRNVAVARFRGLEAEARWALAGGSTFFTGGSWLSISAEVDEALESKYALRPLRDQWIVGYTYRLPDEALLTVRTVRARRTGEETYREVDFRLEVPALGGLLYLDLRNLTDSEHVDPTGNPVAGRAFYVGYRLGPGHASRGGSR